MEFVVTTYLTTRGDKPKLACVHLHHSTLRDDTQCRVEAVLGVLLHSDDGQVERCLELGVGDVRFFETVCGVCCSWFVNFL